MQRFHKVFKTNHCAIIGMIHVKALPGKEKQFSVILLNNFNQINFKHISGTPKYDGNFNAIIEQARCEANIYKKHKIVNI